MVIINPQGSVKNTGFIIAKVKEGSRSGLKGLELTKDPI
jgi:hypothetical protein